MNLQNCNSHKQLKNRLNYIISKLIDNDMNKSIFQKYNIINTYNIPHLYKFEVITKTIYDSELGCNIYYDLKFTTFLNNITIIRSNIYDNITQQFLYNDLAYLKTFKLIGLYDIFNELLQKYNIGFLEQLKLMET